MRKAMVSALLALVMATPAIAEGERAGDFDYYVMALSWSPTWCALEGEARNSPQCDKPFGWVLHGLWPQNERGWPSYCRTQTRDPSRAQTALMADIMGTSGAAWYQWKKHGRCAGLSAEAYFKAARQAYGSIVRPKILRDLDRPVTLPASLIEEAFITDNPQLAPQMITITCTANRIQEARICLTKDLEPRRCGADVMRDCQMKDALFDNIER